MKTSLRGLLAQIASIQAMEPGKLCRMPREPGRTYYNLQCREKGRTLTQYVPGEQVEEVQQHTENYRRFQGLVDEYAGQIIERTRAQRCSRVKKTTRPNSSSPKTRKSRP